MSEHIPPLPQNSDTFGQWLYAFVALVLAGPAAWKLGRGRRKRDEEESDPREIAKSVAAEVVALHVESDRVHREALIDAWREIGRELGEKLDHIAERVDVANDRTRERVAGLLTAQQTQLQRVESGIGVILDRTQRAAQR